MQATVRAAWSKKGAFLTPVESRLKQLGLEQDELAGVGVESQARTAGIADPEWPMAGVGVRPRLAQVIASMAREEGRREPGLGEHRAPEAGDIG